MTHAVAWISHPACRLHDMGRGHPECPRRLAAIEDRLHESGILDFLLRVEAPFATRADLLQVHDAAHVERVFAADHLGAPVAIDDDTIQDRYTLDAALRAAGAGIRGVDLVLDGVAGLAFCCVRPPGHHAERARAMGFCFFNNVAVAAAHALARGMERVAVLDFDLHYGNGTADIFRDDRRLWLYSTYQHPLYPNWDGIPEAPNLVDVPLPAGAGSDAFRHAVVSRWLPALERQRPQLLLVSAGFDGHALDPLGDLRLQTADFRWIGELVRDLAGGCCDGRVVATLEGGYDVDALARSVEAFLQPFLGEGFP